MRLAILILAAAVAFAQDDKLHISGSVSIDRVLWGTTTPLESGITLDIDSRYSDKVLIIRKGGDPIAFCNIKMGRCWDLSITRTGTLRAYDSISHDGAQFSGATRLDVHGTASGGVIGIWDEKIKEKK